MSLKIRLARAGTKKRPVYHIVVADSRSPRDGRFIERLGFFNPLLPEEKTERLKFDIEKATFWGFPVVLTYDTLFVLPMNKRRATRNIDEDPALRSIAKAGKSRALVAIVRAVFAVDKLFEWLPFGPGLLLVARKR